MYSIVLPHGTRLQSTVVYGRIVLEGIQESSRLSKVVLFHSGNLQRPHGFPNKGRVLILDRVHRILMES